jgi:hypothetical protein
MSNYHDKLREEIEKLEDLESEAYLKGSYLKNIDSDDAECGELAERLLRTEAKAEELLLKSKQFRKIGNKLIELGQEPKGSQYLAKASILEARATEQKDRAKKYELVLKEQECKECEPLDRCKEE